MLTGAAGGWVGQEQEVGLGRAGAGGWVGWGRSALALGGMINQGVQNAVGGGL